MQFSSDSKKTKPKIDSSTILLRVKRPFSEPPVECFNTIPCKKRCQGYPEVKKGKCFRYVGSTTEDVGGLDALQDMGAVGARRIFWTSTSTACVINPEDEKTIDYQVDFPRRVFSPFRILVPMKNIRPIYSLVFLVLNHFFQCTATWYRMNNLFCYSPRKYLHINLEGRDQN
ncbi:unnamed protein product [Dibothriocephalus latus]|uniref:Uncharacterized protein n=1 Tax=Dibothriocephalus latus TaxID=60516 RepID=A0A3P7QX45_DIBLA|nr:unnamed protein product [Dibothriocephalus latus]